MSETFQIRRAVRENVRLLLGVSGGTGSGKTWSALEVARGLSGGQSFAVVDTENGRARHYADEFQFDAVDLGAPFRPKRYQAAIQTCIDAGHNVIVVDSMSHEWEGIGGILEWHDELEGGNPAKKMTAWIEPKREHRKLVDYLLQADAHIILCFRAAEKVETVRENGKMVVVPKRSLTGLDGWLPITEKSLPFELTASLMLLATAPGVPKPIKLQQQHRLLVPLDRPLGYDTGRALGEWAAGAQAEPTEAELKAKELVKSLLAIADQLGNRQATIELVAKNRQKAGEDLSGHLTWLEKSIAAGAEQVGRMQEEEDQLAFAGAGAENTDDNPIEF